MGVFVAYSRGDAWNGWETPFFTKEEGQRVADWTDAMRGRDPDGEVETVAWDEERQAFIMSDPRYPGEDEIITGAWREELGTTLYGIGAYKWTWELAS